MKDNQRQRLIIGDSLKTMKDKDLSSEYKESISVQKVETFYAKIERLINRLITSRLNHRFPPL